MSKVVYIGNKNQALIGIENLYLNEEGIIEVKKGSTQEILCQSYNLVNLEELYKKYFSKTKPVKKGK